MKTSPICRGLVLLAMLSAAALADPTPPRVARQLVPQLRSLTYPAGDAQVNGLADAYTAMEEELINQLARDPLTEDQQSYGYYLLGALRVNEAAPLLVERIDFQAKSFDPKISLGVGHFTRHGRP